MKKAIFGAGCFWGVQHEFDQLEGVTKTTVGYLGGHLDKPSYEQVCRGDSGHAEVVEIIYDADKISYNALLDVFWTLHDPTQVNRQGVDVGEQYRTAIFYTSDEQKNQAEQAIKELNASGKYNKPIATEVSRASHFFAAEEYHQHYLIKNGLASCIVKLD